MRAAQVYAPDSFLAASARFCSSSSPSEDTTLPTFQNSFHASKWGVRSPGKQQWPHLNRDSAQHHPQMEDGRAEQAAGARGKKTTAHVNDRVRGFTLDWYADPLP